MGPDFESIALPGAKPLIAPMVYKLKLGYSAGLSADIRNILSGDVNAKLKLKFFWFSKTWRQRLDQLVARESRTRPHGRRTHDRSHYRLAGA